MEIEEVREKAHSVCADYLGGVWKNLKPDDIIIEHVYGGISNFVFKISLPPSIKPIDNEPRTIIMKITLDRLKKGYFGKMTENIIVILLAGKNLSPKVYAIFDGGRLDEFIESRCPTLQDLHNPVILEIIIQKLAQLHCLSPPVNKNHLNACRLEELAEECILGSVPDTIKDNPQLKKLHERFLSLKPQEELQWLKKVRDNVKSPVVFSHNDFHQNNILLQVGDNGSQDYLIRFVDYERSGFYFRGDDLGRLLGCFCITVFSEPPYYKIDSDKFPSEEKQKYIFKLYLNEIEKLTNCRFNMEQELKQIMEEVKIFRLINNFKVATISLFNPIGIEPGINLDKLIAFCQEIFEAYLKEKEMFFTGASANKKNCSIES